RTIGYPTANIAGPEPYKLIPAIGIYAVNCQVNDQIYGGMLSIGTNPTVGGTSVTVEVYIFDFNKDIYGQELTLNFISWLREEEKYDSLEELKAQLQKDEVNAKAALANFAPDTNP